MSSFSERLREERKRLGLNQTEMATLAGVLKGAQVNYEAGKRAPDADYLVAIAGAGANVLYILTGAREGPAPEVLTEDEKGMLADYREASGPVRRAARAALQSGASQTAASVHQSVNARVGGSVTGGSINMRGNTIKNNK